MSICFFISLSFFRVYTLPNSFPYIFSFRSEHCVRHVCLKRPTTLNVPTTVDTLKTSCVLSLAFITMNWPNHCLCRRAIPIHLVYVSPRCLDAHTTRSVLVCMWAAVFWTRIRPFARDATPRQPFIPFQSFPPLFSSYMLSRDVSTSRDDW